MTYQDAKEDECETLYKRIDELERQLAEAHSAMREALAQIVSGEKWRAQDMIERCLEAQQENQNDY